MTRTPALPALALAAGLAALPARAQEVSIAPGAFAGFDGISAECIIHTPDKFADGACAALFKAASAGAQKAGINFSEAGTANWEDVPVKDRKHLDPPAGGPAKPVRLTFFIRGAQSDRITGGFMRAVMWTPAEAEGRSGKLVLWEAATLGAGPRKGLRAAVVKSIADKLETPFAALKADGGKP